MPSFSEPKPSGPSTRAVALAEGEAGIVAAVEGAGEVVAGEDDVVVERDDVVPVAPVSPLWQAVSVPTRPMMKRRTRVFPMCAMRLLPPSGGR